jgi:hypothetical protein
VFEKSPAADQIVAAGDGIRLSSLDPLLDSLIPVTLAKPCSRPRRPEPVRDLLRVKVNEPILGSVRALESALATQSDWAATSTRSTARFQLFTDACFSLSEHFTGRTWIDGVRRGCFQEYDCIVYPGLSWPPISCGESCDEAAGSHPTGGTHTLPAENSFR